MGLDQSIFVIKKDLLKNPPKALEYNMFKKYLRYDKEDDYYYDLDEFAYWGRWHGLNLFILKYFSNNNEYNKQILNGIKELIKEDYYIYYYASW